MVQAMEGEDEEDAGEAARAFRKMTGVDVGTGQFTSPEDEDKTPVERPDPAKARDVLQAQKRTWARSLRIAGGHPLEAKPPNEEILQALSLQSRREVYLRARFAGEWSGRLADLDRPRYVRGPWTSFARR